MSTIEQRLKTLIKWKYITAAIFVIEVYIALALGVI